MITQPLLPVVGKQHIYCAYSYRSQGVLGSSQECRARGGNS